MSRRGTNRQASSFGYGSPMEGLFSGLVTPHRQGSAEAAGAGTLDSLLSGLGTPHRQAAAEAAGTGTLEEGMRGLTTAVSVGGSRAPSRASSRASSSGREPSSNQRRLQRNKEQRQQQRKNELEAVGGRKNIPWDKKELDKLRECMAENMMIPDIKQRFFTEGEPEFLHVASRTTTAVENKKRELEKGKQPKPRVKPTRPLTPENDPTIPDLNDEEEKFVQSVDLDNFPDCRSCLRDERNCDMKKKDPCSRCTRGHNRQCYPVSRNDLRRHVQRAATVLKVKLASSVKKSSNRNKPNVYDEKQDEVILDMAAKKEKGESWEKVAKKISAKLGKTLTASAVQKRLKRLKDKKPTPAREQLPSQRGSSLSSGSRGASPRGDMHTMTSHRGASQQCNPRSRRTPPGFLDDVPDLPPSPGTLGEASLGIGWRLYGQSAAEHRHSPQRQPSLPLSSSRRGTPQARPSPPHLPSQRSSPARKSSTAQPSSTGRRKRTQQERRGSTSEQDTPSSSKAGPSKRGRMGKKG
ncbi:hypothetical protein L207DRAFT_624157 [Hyaloscypha variabilis F]|uniref:Uncharacterized protein n=1 Tax=Hyaloscypha variabilis (strain UAMH 11265 / GT02V1 / F) TaxID=1149755 RepID=A0A2J6RTA1_HYAVF|nr:hypothetical protein L207DRAFT_624157 [Hyaloscypha variabilis F]